MDMLDRYLNAVKSFLPRGQQDDIARELAVNLQAQMDDRAAELGRPLTPAEQEAMLQAHGHPMLVAGRYQTAHGTLVFGRQLIGATLFPFYLRVLWLSLGLALITHVIVVSALVATGDNSPLATIGNDVILQVVTQFAIITGIFAVLDRYLPTMAWSAQHPPTVPPLFPKVQNVRQVARVESAAQIVGLVVVVLWLRFIITQPAALLGPAAANYRLGPVWYAVALPTLLIFAVGIVQAAINLVRPDWLQLRRVARVASDLGSLGIMLYLLRSGPWVVLAHPNGDSAARDLINQYISYGLAITVLATLSVTLVDGWRLLRGSRSA